MSYKSEVIEKLDKIDELFTPERLEKSKERWRRLWAGEPPLDRLPFTFSPISLGYWDMTPREQRLMDYLDEFIYHGLFDDDYIPGMFAGSHQGGMASMFGAKTFEIFNEGVMDTNCVRLLNSIEDIKFMPEPALLPDSIPKRWLDDNKWYIEMTDRRLPIHCVDSFGPVEVAGKLIGYELLYAVAYDEPELYDKLMTYATDAYILFYDAQKDLAGDLFITTCLNAHDWVPQFKTNALGMDGLVMLSQSFFADNVLPYLKRISDKYGPLTLHSCGWFPQLITAICEASFINGLHVSQMSIQELINAGINDKVVIMAFTNAENIANDMSLIKEYGLNVNFCVHGLWKDNQPANWSNADIFEMKEKEKKILPFFSR